MIGEPWQDYDDHADPGHSQLEQAPPNAPRIGSRLGLYKRAIRVYRFHRARCGVCTDRELCPVGSARWTTATKARNQAGVLR